MFSTIFLQFLYLVCHHFPEREKANQKKRGTNYRHRQQAKAKWMNEWVKARILQKKTKRRQAQKLESKWTIVLGWTVRLNCTPLLYTFSLSLTHVTPLLYSPHCAIAVIIFIAILKSSNERPKKESPKGTRKWGSKGAGGGRYEKEEKGKRSK